MCVANGAVQVFVAEHFKYIKRWKWRIGDMISSKTYASQGLAMKEGLKFKDMFKVQPFEFAKQERRHDHTL
jgi:hypothetical protein